MEHQRTARRQRPQAHQPEDAGEDGAIQEVQPAAAGGQSDQGGQNDAGQHEHTDRIHPASPRHAREDPYRRRDAADRERARQACALAAGDALHDNRPGDVEHHDRHQHRHACAGVRSAAARPRRTRRRTIVRGVHGGAMLPRCPQPTRRPRACRRSLSEGRRSRDVAHEGPPRARLFSARLASAPLVARMPVGRNGRRLPAPPSGPKRPASRCWISLPWACGRPESARRGGA